MDAKTEQVLKRLVLAAPQIADQFYDTLPHRCLMMTRIGKNVLDYFGIPARPVLVNAMVGNRAWYEWMQAGMPEGKMPDEAWSVGAHERDTTPSIYGDKGLRGHIILAVDDTLVDLDLRQFGRPEYGIEVPQAGAFMFGQKFWEGDPQVFWTNDNTVVIYVRQEKDDPKNYSYAGDWKRKYKEVSGFLIRMIRHDIHTRTHAKQG